MNEPESLPPTKGLEPTPRSLKTEQLAWIVSLKLVRRRVGSPLTPGLQTPVDPTALPPEDPRASSTPATSPRSRDEIVFVIPDMEFAASALKKASKRHTWCSHPWDLSCALIGRMREEAAKHTTRQLTLDRMGVARTKEVAGATDVKTSMV